MSEGPLVWAGRVVELRQGRFGRVGQVSVRGARTEVVLDLVPEAKAGDTVLVHAGVALTLVTDTPERGRGEG